MGEASLPLQKAIVARLKSEAGIVSNRVYDRPPENATKPYISMGPFDSIPEGFDLYDGYDTTIQIDGWSDKPSSVEIKQLGNQVADALHKASLSLDENRLVSLDVEIVRYLMEPDGLTHHAVVSVRARTEPTEGD